MTSSQIQGTSIDVDVVRAVDGDTIKVLLDDTEENLRLLALDTEESYAGSYKPRTPWGLEAKEEAQSVVPEGSTITIEFPGEESLETCLQRYRDNYGRPLVYVYKDDEDFQEHMIHAGFSPYFTKYGYAHFTDHHRRYTGAERQAQAAHRGVWNQLAVNGTEMRNYSTLGTWWALRAEIIEEYRQTDHTTSPPLLNSRLDYDDLLERVGEQVVVFTELRSYWRAGASHVVVGIGSQRQPFKLFLPDARETEDGQRLLSLLDERYIPAGSDGQTIEQPRRSYAYVSGELTLYQEEPEIVVTSIDQITDEPPR